MSWWWWWWGGGGTDVVRHCPSPCTFCTLPSVFVFCLSPSASHIYLFLCSLSQNRALLGLASAMHFSDFTRWMDGWMDDITLIHSPLILPGIAAAPIQTGSVRPPGVKARRCRLGKGGMPPLGRPPKTLRSAGVIPSWSSVFPSLTYNHCSLVVACVCVCRPYISPSVPVIPPQDSQTLGNGIWAWACTSIHAHA